MKRSIQNESLITKELLDELFVINLENGIIINKVQRSSNCKAGQQVGCLRPDGYLTMNIRGKFYLCHRICYFYFFGKFPEIIDHIDGCKSNNSIKNLREATVKQNAWNRKSKGYYFYKRVGKWMARIRNGDKRICLGYYNTEEEAKLAYIKACKNRSGEFYKE